MATNTSPTVSADQEETTVFAPTPEPQFELLNIEEQQLEALLHGVEIVFGEKDPAKR
jgi:hypothetical protein